MLIEQRLEFIDSLASLPSVITPRAFADFTSNQPPHDINKPTASVMPGTIDAFLPGVSQQTIDDVNLCKLVMQNAASKLYPEDAQLFEWYKYYVEGLKKLGWVIQNKDIQEVTIRRIGLTMDQVALEVSRGLIGANAAQILATVGKLAVDAVQQNPRAIEIFNYGYKLGKQAKFDIAPVWVDNNGQANMVLNCISLDARESTRGILFWKSTRQSTTIKTGAVRTYLDNNVFARLRDAMYQKYSDAGQKFIEELPDF
ncbi:hypothetical protein DKY63_22490 [Pseudomonas putida]|uniref:Uncharacterized protein n=1 Tax=Pseudomonas putida TaxID=303 RepID=A0A2Z4RNJ8_PSEPU|nr:hypothetical protein [Pseudomonas putida]AWY42526.1 hypothetical protein DKY63_22490 [Pseudomonas putida]